MLLSDPEKDDDNYSDDGGDTSARRKEKRSSAGFQPGTRPAAELALYVKEQEAGVWTL